MKYRIIAVALLSVSAVANASPVSEAKVFASVMVQNANKANAKMQAGNSGEALAYGKIAKGLAHSIFNKLPRGDAKNECSLAEWELDLANGQVSRNPSNARDAYYFALDRVRFCRDKVRALP